MSDIKQLCEITEKEFIVTAAEQEHIRNFEVLHPLLKPGDIPLPTIHPLELMRQMQSFVTLDSLFEAKSAISGKDIITRYNPVLGYRVCTHDEFWSDAVDNTAVGKVYDFSRPFFEQWNELMHEVYMQPLVQINCENSPYIDSSSQLKNCYMCFGAGESVDCCYCIKTRYPLRNRDCVDGVGITDCELCYACVDCHNCYNLQHCQDCKNSRDSFGSYDVIGCDHCFGCYGLRHQSFMIFNKQVTADEYADFIVKANLGNYVNRQKWLRECVNFTEQAQSVDHVYNSDDSSGNYLEHCQNAYQCFLAENLQDCGWSTGAKGKDCWRSEVMEGELAYNSVVLFGRLGYGNSIHTGSENFYSYMIFNSSSCFGGAMLKNKSYCILNKQYSKEEYCELVPRIIAHMKATGEWGKFLPPAYAPHFYHESQSALWFEPLAQQDLQKYGYRVASIPTSRIGKEHVDIPPADIHEVKLEEVLQTTFYCTETHKPYRLDRREVLFYQKQGIPLPRVHWQERLHGLLAKVLPIHL